jgi:hypothetical protein
VPEQCGASVHVLHRVDNTLLLSIIEQAFKRLKS